MGGLGSISGARLGALVILALGALVLIVQLILHRRKASHPRIRPLAAFQDLQKEIGRAAESGKPLHIALGNGGLNGEDAMVSLAGLQVVEALADAAVFYNVPPVITLGDPTLLPLAQDVLRRVYERQGLMDLYDPSRVRFVASSPVAYATGAADVVASEKVIASIVAGDFGAEVSLIADAAARRDLPQLAAVADSRAIGALYPATDRLAVGEEMFAARAQMTGEQGSLAGLLAEDVLRVLLVLAILGAAALSFLGF